MFINLENLKEIDAFVKRWRPPKLNQEEFNSLYRPITNEIETVIKNFPAKNVQNQIDSQNSTKYSKMAHSQSFFN